jgi:hypothetical protein
MLHSNNISTIKDRNTFLKWQTLSFRGAERDTMAIREEEKRRSTIHTSSPDNEKQFGNQSGVQYKVQTCH